MPCYNHKISKLFYDIQKKALSLTREPVSLKPCNFLQYYWFYEETQIPYVKAYMCLKNLKKQYISLTYWESDRHYNASL